MTKLEQTIDSCLVIFELTSRSVPSNHMKTIQDEIEKLKQIKKDLQELEVKSDKKVKE